MKETVEIVRCRHCEYYHWEQDPEHGKSINCCSMFNIVIPHKDYFCPYGRERNIKDGRENI